VSKAIAGDFGQVAATVPADIDRFDVSAAFAHCREKLKCNGVPEFRQVVAEIPETAPEKPQDRCLIEALPTDARDTHAAA
jgi:crotonobetaine/carnitine-CoA ligase